MAVRSSAVNIQLKNNPIRGDMLICAFLGLVFWVCRYWRFGSYGLYEDDLTIIPNAVQMNFSELFRYIGSYISHLYGHGRPLSDSLIDLFSNLGWRLNELKGIYLIGFALTLINIILFYALLRRTTTRNIALLAGIFYVLYAADTTQVFLTHSLGAQPSITLVLLAFHAYLSGHRIIGYLLAAIILFSYETPYLVFLAAPLLSKEWGRPMIRKFITHAAILLVFLGAIYLLRIQIGEGRVAGLSTEQMFTSPVTHSIIGPIVSLGTYLLRPYQAVRAADGAMIAAFVISTMAFGIIFMVLKWDQQASIKSLIFVIRSKTRWGEIPQEIKSLGRITLAGAVMLISAYPLTFTVRAYAISGRDTRVHLAGVMGAAIIVASVVALFFIFLRRKKLGWILPVIISIWAAALVSYGFVIQRDYKLGWQYQREFWTFLVQLVPDAGENTVILVSPGGLQDVRQIGANTWNLPRILNQLYVMPAEWKNPPRVYRLVDNWEDFLVGTDGTFQLNVNTVTAPPSLYGKVAPQRVIFIDPSSGSLVRREQPLVVGSTTYTLQPTGTPVLEELKKGLLYSLLIEDSRVP